MSQLESMDRASNSLQDAEEVSTSATKMVAPTLRVSALARHVFMFVYICLVTWHDSSLWKINTDVILSLI